MDPNRSPQKNQASRVKARRFMSARADVVLHRDAARTPHWLFGLLSSHKHINNRDPQRPKHYWETGGSSKIKGVLGCIPYTEDCSSLGSIYWGPICGRPHINRDNRLQISAIAPKCRAQSRSGRFPEDAGVGEELRTICKIT